MKNNSGGFTLTETLIATAVVGLLAAIAIPSYSYYVNSAQVSEAFRLMDSERIKINQIQRNGSCTAVSGTPDVIKGKYGLLTISGTYTPSEGLSCPSGCNFSYTHNSSGISNKIAGKAISAQLLNNGKISKITGSTSIPNQYLPSTFRTIGVTAGDVCTRVKDDPLIPTTGTVPTGTATGAPPPPPPPPPTPPVTPPSPPVTSPSPPVTPPPSGGTGSTSPTTPTTPTTPDVSVLPNPSLTSTAGWYKDANLTTLVGVSTNRRDTYVVFDLKNVKGGEVLELTGTDYNELTVFTIDVTLLGDSSKLTSPIGFNTLYALYKSPQRGNIPIRTIPITIPQGITGNVRLVFKSSALTAHHTMDRGASRFDFILKHNNVQIGAIATVYRS